VSKALGEIFFHPAHLHEILFRRVGGYTRASAILLLRCRPRVQPKSATSRLLVCWLNAWAAHTAVVCILTGVAVHPTGLFFQKKRQPTNTGWRRRHFGNHLAPPPRQRQGGIILAFTRRTNTPQSKESPH
jgi:hypothetical protein